VLEASWHAAKFPTYQYEFTRGYEPQGAVHSWELQYVFGNLSPQASDDKDRKLSDQVQQYWANFARTGNPNGAGVPAWPTLDSLKKGYIEFTPEGAAARSGLRGRFCELFFQKMERH
jgi:carboxylesterase type B